MTRYTIILAAIFATTACQYSSTPNSLQDTPPPQAQTGHDTLSFVQAACGGCHAVEAGYLSPNPQAPRWEDIANREGLSGETLATWLYDAHNYPEMMDFNLDRPRAKAIADYMLQLRSGDYRPLPE